MAYQNLKTCHSSDWGEWQLRPVFSRPNVSFWLDSVEKQRVAGAESRGLNEARVPFLSGFARLLRCRKDLRQFAEVLGGGGEEEFVVCAAWTT